MNKNVIMGGIAAVALGIAIWLMLGGSGGNNEDAAERMDQVNVWICRSCKGDVRMTKQQWTDLAMAGNFNCPSCGGVDLVDAVACPLCDKSIETLGHGRLPTTCVHCNGTLGDWRDVSDSPGLEREAGGPPPG